MRNRILFGVTTLTLVIIEVLIALYVHDAFIRPYIGDVLVVVVIYCFIRIFIPDRFALLPLGVFIFAAGVELLQAINIVGLLGVENNPFLRVLIGSTFDVKDIACYGVGCLLLAGFEFYRNSRKA